MKVVRLHVNADIERVLNELKAELPTLDYPEILKLALSELYQNRLKPSRVAKPQNQQQSQQGWANSLPVMELNEEQQKALGEALEEIKQGSTSRPMRASEVMDLLNE